MSDYIFAAPTPNRVKRLRRVLESAQDERPAPKDPAPTATVGSVGSESAAAVLESLAEAAPAGPVGIDLDSLYAVLYGDDDKAAEVAEIVLVLDEGVSGGDVPLDTISEAIVPFIVASGHLTATLARFGMN